MTSSFLCKQKLCIEELDKAIMQMSVGKSPGLDSLMVEFYSRFFSGKISELCLIRL